MSGLTTWTVYDHPRDFPHCYVARRFEGERPTGDLVVAADLDALRQQLIERGLVCLDRDPEDDPAIMETWL